MVLPTSLDDVYEDEDAGDTVGLGCALEMFSESKEVLGMIKNLICESDSLREWEKAYERFKYIINQYKEQPHLIDPYLDEILSEIIFLIRNVAISLSTKHKAFKYLHLITNVRGYKAVVQHLPHEVQDLEPILKLLEEQDEKDTETWETRYCLLLWLSIIVMIPFHMTRLDSGVHICTVMDRLVAVCKKYIMIGDACQQAAAFLSARFLTRSDVKEVHLANFIDWACQIIISSETGWEKFGPLASLASVLKHGKREDLLPHAPTILNCISESNCYEDYYRLSGKYAMKITSRIGLTYLKVKVASWRYSRGSRCLIANLNVNHIPNSTSVPVNGSGENNENIKTDDDSDDQDIPAQMEEIIDLLIRGLKNKDITIRWSAAKGIGRIVGRLNQELGDEVVSSILELLSTRENDNAWHGGCLALAELGKRGLLLPGRLYEVVPLVIKALTFDEPRGYNSVGSHIRDAACYVFWAFARAYDPDVLEPFVEDIARALVVVTCFDREINCRRAASAAFQENVGRQGTFPHGIEILTAADYFAVGIRTNSFLNVSVFIAQFKEYTKQLIDHLLERKLDHWDSNIRELAAKALHNLTFRDVQYMCSTVLPSTLQMAQSDDLNARHGGILALGEVVHGVALVGCCHNIDQEYLDGIGNLVSIIRQKQQLRGMSGELMKLACSYLIQKCSVSKLPYHGTHTVGDWQQLIDECLCHEVNKIRSSAAQALSAFCLEYYCIDGSVLKSKQTELVSNYTSQLSASNETIRMGHALALGLLPDFMLKGETEKIILSLITCASITEHTKKWAESRKEAVNALTSICTAIGIIKEDRSSCWPFVKQMLGCFIEGLKDYTSDSRGDIGAWVREACMIGLQVVTQCTVKADESLLTPELVTNIMACISQQAVEKIDRTRGHAGRVFINLLYSDPCIPNIPHRAKLTNIFEEKTCKESLNWTAASDTFPLFTQLLDLTEFSYSIMLGLIVSVGGLTESLVKHSSAALFQHLKVQPVDELERLADIILKIFAEYQYVERITIPLLTFLERVLSSNYFHPVLENSASSFAADILKMVKEEIGRTTDTKKLTVSVDVFCQLIQVQGEVSRRSLVQLSIMLCHRFKWLRKVAASKLYEALMVYSEECELKPDNLDQALTLLSDTEWDRWPLEQIREIRNNLCQVLGIPLPTVVKK